MKLAVISLTPGGGASTITAMIAEIMSLTQDLKSVITYTSKDRAVARYLGVEEDAQDKLRSISQVVKLLDAKAISPEALDTYLIPVDDKCYILDTVSDSIKESEAAKAQTFCFDRVIADLSICDISYALSDPRAQDLIEIADAVCFVINPGNAAIEAFKYAMQSPYFPSKEKPFFVVINKYAEEVAGVRVYAQKMGIPARSVCKLHHNPWITRCADNGLLREIIAYCKEDDLRVLNLTSDFREILQWLGSFMKRKVKW